MNVRRYVIWSAALFIFACAPAGPDYYRSDPPVPEQYGCLESKTGGHSANLREITLEWWKGFNDPALDSLMARAVSKSPDLQIAAARVRQARALRGIASSNHMPEGGATAGYQRQRRTESGFSNGISGIATGGNANDREGDLYQAGFDASWEIDIFGGVRREVEAADAELAAVEEARKDALVTLRAEIARNYMELRTLQLRLDIAAGDIRARRHIVELNRNRYTAGLITELDLSRARGVLATSEAVVPVLDRSLHEVMHRLAVLSGLEPMRLVQELSQPGVLPQVPENLLVGLPSDLLRCRPDIREAERELAAATARIGVATADLFPRFSLTGSFGYQNKTPDNLMTGPSNFWNIGPDLRWNILNLKRIVNTIKAGRAERDRLQARYHQQVLVALEEVENALVGISREKIRTASLQQAVDANRLATRLAETRYQAGLENYLSVIDAQLALRTSRDLLAVSRRNSAIAFISLCKALGGGTCRRLEEAPRETEGTPGASGKTQSEEKGPHDSGWSIGTGF